MGLGQVGRDREGALGCGWRGHAETGGHSRDCPWLVTEAQAVSYTHLTLPTRSIKCRSRWSPYH